MGEGLGIPLPDSSMKDAVAEGGSNTIKSVNILLEMLLLWMLMMHLLVILIVGQMWMRMVILM